MHQNMLNSTADSFFKMPYKSPMYEFSYFPKCTTRTDETYKGVLISVVCSSDDTTTTAWVNAADFQLGAF